MRLFVYQYRIPLLALLALFLTAALHRPLLPIDETRYMSVAWEMLVRHDWFLLTKNFEPYHHKPPLLFWLINASWSVFGVSRWAALVPIFLSSAVCLFLCRELAQRVFPGRTYVSDQTPLLMVASLPFLIYSTLVMFDVTMMALVMGALIAIMSYAQSRKFVTIILIGLLTGLAVLTKGPVAYLYILPPFLLGPVWFRLGYDHDKKSWYLGCAISILVSIIPVLIWLLPILRETDHDFAVWLLWKQTAGRISGHMNAAHARPFYFYVLLLPLFILPWVFLPEFWRNLKPAKWPQGFTFLICWFVPVFVAFSFISGKQPHYLVPLFPAILIATSYQLRNASPFRINIVAFFCVALICVAQIGASHTLLKPYDLRPIAQFIIRHPQSDFAYAGEYHAEFNFLARRQEPVTEIKQYDITAWLSTHPEGYVIAPYKSSSNAALQKRHVIEDMPYRGKRIAIIQ